MMVCLHDKMHLMSSSMQPGCMALTVVLKLRFAWSKSEHPVKFGNFSFYLPKRPTFILMRVVVNITMLPMLVLINSIMK